jgi:putative peptidoglycan lipid II flippase
VSWLNIAFRLMQLPLGIFGVAVATVTLPLVSRSAAVGNTSEFRSALAHSIRLVLLLTIPAAIGLIILAEPIIQLIYEHGRFTPESTMQTAGALRFYAIGLAGYSADKVLAPAFYALNKRYVPMFVTLTSIAINFSLNWVFIFYLHWGHRGLAFSTSMVAITNFFFLYTMMRHYTGRLETGTMFRTVAKLLLAGAVLAGICWLASEFFFSAHHHLAVWKNFLALMVTIAAAAAAFFGTAYLLRVAEVHDLVDLVRRRFARNDQPSA